MDILEICSGSKVLSQTFKNRGHNTFTIDINADYHPDLIKDAEYLKLRHLPYVPDVIWFSPPCTSYSIAGISHHRKQNENGDLDAVSFFAKKSDRLITHILNLIDYINLFNPNLIVFIENPRGGLRKMPFMKKDNLINYTITYCQYGDTRMKPTDIWSNKSNIPFKPMCHNGDPCHESAPRGSKTGTQGLINDYERSKLPQGLCDFIVNYCEGLHEIY